MAHVEIWQALTIVTLGFINSHQWDDAGTLVARLTFGKTLIRSKKIWHFVNILYFIYFAYVATGYGAGLGNDRYGFASAEFFLLLALTGYEAQFGINPPAFLTTIGTVSFSVYLMYKRGMSIALR